MSDIQNNVIKEILQDLGSSNQMIRLLQGDVGSGKTIVALISMIKVGESNFQSALMVPTTILFTLKLLTTQIMPMTQVLLNLTLGGFPTTTK